MSNFNTVLSSIISKTQQANKTPVHNDTTFFNVKRQCILSSNLQSVDCSSQERRIYGLPQSFIYPPDKI